MDWCIYQLTRYTRCTSVTKRFSDWFLFEYNALSTIQATSCWWSYDSFSCQHSTWQWHFGRNDQIYEIRVKYSLLMPVKSFQNFQSCRNHSQFLGFIRLLKSVNIIQFSEVYCYRWQLWFALITIVQKNCKSFNFDFSYCDLECSIWVYVITFFSLGQLINITVVSLIIIYQYYK